MKNINIIFIVSFIFISIISKAQNKYTHKRPKLVVGIVVEGMKTDYLSRFSENFGSGGFNRLILKGKQYVNAQYDYMYPESSSGYTTIITGANPATHGIIADKWYNRLNKKYVNCVEDQKYANLGSTDFAPSCSPKKILCSSLGDALRLSNFKQSKVISIALKNYAAVLAGGHSNNGAFWLDINTGKFISSGYYFSSLPLWVKYFNDKNLAETYMSRTWDTFYSLTKYHSLGDDNRYEKGYNGTGHVFPYSMSKMRFKNNHYDLLNYTPYGNTLIREFAVSALVNEKLGKDKYPDIMMLSFSANAGIVEKFGMRSVEIEDAYIRLDHEIEILLDFIDDYLGLQNVLIFLTADKGSEDIPLFLQDLSLPTCKFNRKGTFALTKSYLKAFYKESFIIEQFDKYGIYFDYLKLDKLNISASEIQNKTADFIVDFTGISAAYSANRIQSGMGKGKYALVQNQFMLKRSPDVLIEFEVGAIDKDEKFFQSGNRNYLNVPLIFFGWKVKPGRSSRRISMTDIAPSISDALQISYPNASSGNPIDDLFETSKTH